MHTPPSQTSPTYLFKYKLRVKAFCVFEIVDGTVRYSSGALLAQSMLSPPAHSPVHQDSIIHICIRTDTDREWLDTALYEELQFTLAETP